MKKSILNLGMMLVLLLAFTGMRAQTWNTVGSGLNGGTIYEMESVVANGELYVAYHTNNGDISVEKWNGLSWTTYPTFTPTAGWWYNISMAVYGGEIYIGSSGGLIKFDGQNWSVEMTNYVGALRVINNELFIGESNGAVSLFDGTNYTLLPTLPNGFRLADVEHYGGDFYVSGWDTIGSLSSPINTLKLAGSSWVPAAHYYDSNPATPSWHEAKVFAFNNELYVTFTDKLYNIKNDTAFYIGVVPEQINAEPEYAGKIYLIGDSASTPAGLHIFDGTGISQVVGEPSNLEAGSTYNGELHIFSGIDKIFNGITYNHAFRTQAGFSLLNGTVYMDGNGDCFMNSGEAGASQIMIALNDSDVFVTDANGEYSFSVAPGAYGFDSVYSTHSIGKNLEVNCALPTSINVGANQTITNDIGTHNPVATDMQTFITGFAGWRARFGFTEVTRIDVNNAGNATVGSATVNVDVPASLTVVSTDPLPSSVSGNTYSFDFLNVQPLESRQVDITVIVDTANNSLGDSLLWSAYLNPVPGEADPADNTDSLGQTVTGAYDPNDKQASAYQILPGTEEIDYQIRFQNTGTDSAVNVTVVDTLDMTLPITHIVINSASHPYSLSVNNNILIWEFNNIMLPDSGADLAGSQGYVRFSAGISPGLNVGDTIDNDAEIYFDYQVPVHTNHAKTAIVTTLSLLEHDSKSTLINVYPNPAQDVLYLHSDKDSKSMTFKLINQTGQTIDELELKPGEKTEYSVAGLAVGVYILWSDSQSYRLVITR